MNDDQEDKAIHVTGLLDVMFKKQSKFHKPRKNQARAVIMGRQVLTIQSDDIVEVTRVIRAGMKHVKIPKYLERQLKTWCDEEDLQASKKRRKEV